MPVVPGFRSSWHGFIYDTVAIAAAAAISNPTQFFTLPIGQGTSPTVGSGNKQFQDTNLQEGQKLPYAASDMWVKSLRLIVSGTATPNDLNRLFRNFVARFTVNNAEYQSGPLELFPAGGGPFTMGQLSTAQLAMTTTTFGVSNGYPSCGATVVFNEPIGIGQGETFRLDLVGNAFTLDAAAGTTLGAGLFLRTVLEGQITQAANQR